VRPGEAAARVRQTEDCDDELERTLLRSIQDRGYSILSEPAQADHPAYSYTVGLIYRFEHPELVVVGLTRERGEALLLVAAELVKQGAALAPGSVNTELLHDYPCHLGPVAIAQHRAYLGYARWYYRGDGFTAVQVIWPDREGRFPNEADFAAHLRAQQPILE
jgi:hypothetical protein